MLLEKIRLIFFAILFLATFDIFYLDYLVSTFGYAYFDAFQRGWSFKAIIYFLSILPILFSSNNRSSSSIGINLLYAIYFLPSLLVIQYMSDKSNYYVFFFAFILSINMIILFLSNRLRLNNRPKIINYYRSEIVFKKLYKLILVIAFVGVFMLVYYFRNSMQLVGLMDVYELRAISDEVQRPRIFGYINLFLIYSAMPFLIGYGLVYKNKFSIVFGLTGSFLVYLSFGSKIALAMPFAIFIIWNFLFKSKSPLLIMLILLVFVTILLLMIDVSGTPFEVLKSIFAWRTLANSGWMLEKYDEFFSVYGHSYWTHIGFIGSFVNGEVTDQYELGQLIGIHYFDSITANYNAGFWASDGIASAGIFGIFVPTFILSMFIVLINALTLDVDQRLINIWFLGFWMVILNAPLTVGFIGAGSILNIILLILCLSTFKKRSDSK